MGKTITGSSAAPWTEEHMHALRRMFDRGLGDAEIGARLLPRRTSEAVRHMRHIMGLVVPRAGWDRWTSGEASTLEKMFRSGSTDDAIAEALGRTAASVKTYRRRRGLVREHGTRGGGPQAAAGKVTRACMCCRIPFLSEGVHNRMCDPCRGSAADQYGLDDYHVAA